MLAMHRVQSRYFLVILRCEVEIFKTLPEEIAMTAELENAQEKKPRDCQKLQSIFTKDMVHYTEYVIIKESSKHYKQQM